MESIFQFSFVISHLPFEEGTFAGLNPFQPALAPEQERLAGTEPVANAVAGCALEENSVFYLALPRRSLEHDVFNAFLDAQDLSAKTQHRGSEQETVMFAVYVERGFDLRNRLHPNHLTWLKVQRLLLRIRLTRAGDKSPRLESAEVS